MVLTEKENSILDNAEDAILKQVQLFRDLEAPMGTEQCDILHSLIGTLDRICRLKGYRENQLAVQFVPIIASRGMSVNVIGDSLGG